VTDAASQYELDMLQQRVKDRVKQTEERFNRSAVELRELTSILITYLELSSALCDATRIAILRHESDYIERLIKKLVVHDREEK